MFIGKQNDLIAFLGQTREELENLPMVELTSIEEVDFAEMYNGKIYIDQDELIEAKKTAIRAIRNQYLVDYVDGPVSNPIRWADMPQEEKDMYINYRKYLLDYTETENWWEQKPLTLDEWKERHNEEVAE